MAMDNLKVFQEESYSSAMELLDYNFDLMNQMSDGGLVLSTGRHQGDFSTKSLWRRVEGLVRRRSPYEDVAINQKVLSMGEYTTVKVGGGTEEMVMVDAWMEWINRAPAEAAAVFGRNLAEQYFDDITRVAISAYLAATMNDANAEGAEPGLWNNVTADNINFAQFLETASRFGDRFGEIRSWMCHSGVMFRLWGNNLQNANALFQFGNVRVMTDALGKPFIVTDHPLLIDTSAADSIKYTTLGLTGDAVRIEQNDDWNDNTETKNGRNNIVTTYQAEWSYQVGVKGYSWDKQAGGKAPTNESLGSSASWERYAESYRDLAGVVQTVTVPKNAPVPSGS